ncbi:unnamed protein product [Microthlaspi erraticum]|uniref:F-box domain-containing protein n=1 Tax=Microthlaspi erraticum TaxID=1685480 RepID=A0A6D2JL65_9BRAS|nr:unnamed protein product [Microthlaspi erraticum]
MTTMSNIPEDLVGEILSRVPMTSLGKVRCTCKAWNALSKIQIFGKKAAARKQVLGFMVIGSRVCSFSLDLQGILSERDLVVPSIKKISKFDERKISYVSHIDGLLFCVDNEKLLVWNPYLGKTRWIQRPKIVSDQNDMFAFGYNNNRNHKIFRILHEYNKGDGEDLPDIYELYDFNSNSWRRVPDVKQDFYVVTDRWLVSLKGNTYLVAEDRAVDKYFLLCFDFTMERFGPRLPLPYNSVEYSAAISCVREEQLAILYQDEETMDIWTTTKILPNAVSWIKFFKVEMTTLNGFPDDFGSEIHTESFFIDEEKKVVYVLVR